MSFKSRMALVSIVLCSCLTGMLSGCSGEGNDSNLFIPTPTTQPTITPTPPRNTFVGNYSGTYKTTTPDASPVSRLTGPITFTVRSDGSVLLLDNAPGSGHCDLATGTISWNATATSTPSGIQSFTGQLHKDAKGLITGAGTLKYAELIEFAFGPWTVKKG
ncbi:MAG: hypothetical protein JO316_09095 [Abitibacteriaceae bacterium]|nr:hypothetical protein [Abditibacteriaceae bacterium]